MPFIGKNPTAGFATIVKDDFTADGTTTVFTLSKQVATVNDIAVYVGNVRQEPTDAYTVNGTTLTMSAAPATGVNFYVLHIAGTIESSVVPPDGSIGSAKLIYPLTTFSSTGIDDNATSTSMTLTSSNDVAFGNTAANLVSNTSTQGGGGYVASDKHFEFATNSNRAPVEIGKNNANDGQLVAFRKQGTTVGSIGTNSGDVYIAGTTHGLKFDSIDASTMYIRPVNNSGSNVTGQIDLGQAGNVFRDAYVSGGVYFAPNAYPANYLDGYEEGTWVPTIRGSTVVGAATYTTQQGTYTKIGNVVKFQAEITWTSHNGSGQLEVGNYPFTSTAESSPISLTFYGGTTFGSGYFVSAYKNPSSTTSGTGQTNPSTSAFSSVSITNAGTVWVNGVYQTS
jgi:hypothetical protein